uniref:monodehydroascorbate reductase (NADH) n=1 Tax=Anthurium amnicola TaxID=1678845 RepID=A0A1D1Y777_9ARAE
MGRSFVYVILGGGVAAGYAALEFTRRGVKHGQLCIISEEDVAPYERPALSKGFLLPEAPARLPQFHTCVGANEENLTPKWYEEHGIELLLGTCVNSADFKRKTLHTASGETISYKILIVATGARALKLEDLGVKGSDAENIFYLRNLADATRLVNAMQTCAGGNAVVIGGGYIGMECAAALVTNRVKVTMVFPNKHCMDRLFTPKIADFYEKYYESKGVKFIKENAVTSFENNSGGKVMAVILRDGTRVLTDMVVVGVGARANTSLFEGQLFLEKGGIKVNGQMHTSNRSLYAVGDIAAFPVKLFGGDIRRFEHVDCARKTAKHAVAAIMNPWRTGNIDYLPFFYSRVFTLSWQFYGDNSGEVVHFGDFSSTRFGAYWVENGLLVGAFLEGGNREEYEAIAKAIRLKLTVKDLLELENSGLEFALQANTQAPPATTYVWHITVGAVLAGLIAAFAYWYAVSCGMQ